MNLGITNFENFRDLLLQKIKQKIESRDILSLFAEKRRSFEGWLKVELCDILMEFSEEITPEYHIGENKKIDILLDDCAIELKIITTQYVMELVENGERSVATKKNEILEDIEKLRSLDFDIFKIIIFVVYPIKEDNQFEHWGHLNLISKKVDLMESQVFSFKNSIKGKIYIGLVKDLNIM